MDKYTTLRLEQRGETIASILQQTLPEPYCLVRTAHLEWIVQFQGNRIGGFCYYNGWFRLECNPGTLLRYREQVQEVKALVQSALSQTSGRRNAA